MFRDRKDAGRKLGLALMQYRGKYVSILAIPCGGVEVAFEVAKHLNAELDILISRKLPLPENPEAGFGAIAEDGSIFINRLTASHLSSKTIEQIKKRQIQEIQRRIDVLRSGRALTSISNKTIILVDDGIAMGSTMRAAVMLCKNKDAKKIIVASPVAGHETVREISRLVDEVVILEEPVFFQAVAQVYDKWYDVPDSEVIQIMNTWRKRNTRNC